MVSTEPPAPVEIGNLSGDRSRNRRIAEEKGIDSQGISSDRNWKTKASDAGGKKSQRASSGRYGQEEFKTTKKNDGERGVRYILQDS